MTTRGTAILGIGGIHDRGMGHDASAALIVDGKLVAAVEEERFSRVKKHVRLGYPFKAIEYCLKAAGIRFQDLSDIAIESRVVHHRHLLSALESAFGSFTAKPHLVGHHMAHAASAVFASPFDEGSFIVVDAHGGVAGNGITTLAGGFKGNALEVLEEIWSPYSLGLAWAYVTDALGFNKQTDAGKVMALASYSTDPRFSHLVKRVDSSFISVLDSSVFRELKVDKSDFEESAALAYALQLATEECMKSMAGKLRAHYKSGNLCLAGGVSLNSVANGLLLLEGYADRIFIQPAADDSGLSLGAAYYVNHITYGNRKKGWLRNVFLGPEYDDKGVLAALEKSGLPYYVPEDRYAACSKLLAAGEILGWFQGRMEYGPRALGNRSILCSPLGEKTKDILNAKVKHRESFRPFAAAVLADEAADYFTISDSPFMLLVGKPKRDDMPAITHVDGTTRLQTVTDEDSPELFNLLSAFKKDSGLPVLLNTSLNVMGEPIVENPDQAIRCFLETEMDAMCLGRHLLLKNPADARLFQVSK